MPAEQPNITASLPEQREASSPVPSLESFYENIIQNYEYEKDLTLLNVDKTIADIPIPVLAKLLRDAATGHGTDKKQIISKEQGIGSYAITHSAEATALDILASISILLLDDASNIQFDTANIALAQLLRSTAKKSEVARLLRQKISQLDASTTRFSIIVAALRAKVESGEQALARFEEQFYDAEILANIYTLQNA
jgi:hypothetical protein